MMVSFNSSEQRRLLLLFLLISVFIQMKAQRSNVQDIPFGGEFLQEKFLSLGGSNVYDSYLSLNSFSGPMIGAGKWTRRGAEIGNGFFDCTDTYFRTDISAMTSMIGNNGGVLTLTMDYRGSLDHLLYSSEHVSFLAGPAFVSRFGAVYNMSNSNNPVQAKLFFSLAFHVNGVYHFNIDGCPMSFSYDVAMPLIGTSFSPEYGQTYYEIYKFRQYSRVFHFSWPGNTPALFQLLSMDVPMGNCRLRLSMAWDIYHYELCHLESDMRNILFNIGLVRKFQIKYNGQ